MDSIQIDYFNQNFLILSSDFNRAVATFPIRTVHRKLSSFQNKQFLTCVDISAKYIDFSTTFNQFCEHFLTGENKDITNNVIYL